MSKALLLIGSLAAIGGTVYYISRSGRMTAAASPQANLNESLQPVTSGGWNALDWLDEDDSSGVDVGVDVGDAWSGLNWFTRDEEPETSGGGLFSTVLPDFDNLLKKKAQR